MNILNQLFLSSHQIEIKGYKILRFVSDGDGDLILSDLLVQAYS